MCNVDAGRFAAVVVLAFALIGGDAAAEAGRALQVSSALGEAPASVSGHGVSVVVAGAVERPGGVSLSAEDATVAKVLQAVGGASRQGYRLATLLLRRTGQNAEPACLPAASRHAMLLIKGDPTLGSRDDLVTQLSSGQLIRLDARDAVVAEAVPLLLQDGDLLALPQRTGTVYVAGAQGAIVRMQHDPTAAAKAYLAQLPKAERQGVDEFVLHYPNGRTLNLALDAWNYQPTMVPPGSLIAPGSVCFQRD